MNVQRFQPDEFYRLAAPMLLHREAENNFTIGLSQSLSAEPPKPEHLFAIVFDAAGPIATAVMTPPHPLIVTGGSSAAMDAIAEFIHHNNIQISGVGGPTEAATSLACALAKCGGPTLMLKTRMKIMQVDRVIAPRPVDGTGRFAQDKDFELLVEWMDAFARAIGEPNPTVRENVTRRLKSGHFFLWEDPHPVSIAGWTGPTPSGVRINSVFTPPPLRGHGYASNCVAALTQNFLSSGKKFCFLYTDQANLTSNKIYQQIGYKHVCDWADWRHT